MKDPNYYIEKSLQIKNNWDKYDIVKQVSQEKYYDRR